MDQTSLKWAIFEEHADVLKMVANDFLVFRCFYILTTFERAFEVFCTGFTTSLNKERDIKVYNFDALKTTLRRNRRKRFFSVCCGHFGALKSTRGWQPLVSRQNLECKDVFARIVARIKSNNNWFCQKLLLIQAGDALADSFKTHIFVN